ncbi:hypothetical protein CVIRNUC_004832 [Coccomyxa viridis]|uniref:Uncharacterized protein n=1 Tax=Coccomyxa viridis TaxID=1274662 RepID=A0AAV1I6U7_9CHLO|nr:hypothetical protein CVIRNUC_004832 [Coccomyxa viridis]
MGQQHRKHRLVVPLLCTLATLQMLTWICAQDLDSPEYISSLGASSGISEGPGNLDVDDMMRPVGEATLSGTEEDGEGGDDLLDLGAMISSKAPSTTSTGGAAVASSFNFTKAAEMRAAAMQRQSAASPASTPVRGLQPGIKSGTEPPGRAAKAGALLPAQPGGSMSGDAPPSVSPTDSTQGAAGGAGPSQAAGGSAGMLTDASLRDQRSIAEASVLSSSTSDPRLELGADANTTRAAVTNFKGAHHIARRQARHYKALPGSISDECMARLTTLVSTRLGQYYKAGNLAELLGNVSTVMLRQAEKQMDDVLSSVLSDTASEYIDFHLSHITNKYDECRRSPTLPTLKNCLTSNRKKLRHVDIMWFDENWLTALLERLGDVRSVFGFGSGRGDFERYFFEQGVAYSYGLEPGFLGSLAFYAAGWEYREGPVQLTALLPTAQGMAELEEFRCYMTGDAHHRVDLVQSIETLEEIPREEHCGVINDLAGMASRWIAVTMGQLGQGGGHHIANRHKEDFLSEWTRRGLVYRGDLTESIKETCELCQLHYLRYNLLIFEVDPSRVVLMDCDLESPAEWAPYENYVEQLLYLPNGTRSPSRLHEKQYSDWQYVLRLKAG